MGGAKLARGLVQVYTGNGKGKTTAAIGQAMRAIGHGLAVCMIQFFKKGTEYGELQFVNEIGDNSRFMIKQFGTGRFIDFENPSAEDLELVMQGLEYAKEIIAVGSYDLVILDEINLALDAQFIDIDEFIKLIEQRPSHVELILTGRHAPDRLIEAADLVTEMVKIKHPFDDGITSREGIEY